MDFQHLKRFFIVLMAVLLAGCTPGGDSSAAPDDEPASSNTELEQPPTIQKAADYLGLAYYSGENINPVLSTSHMNRILSEALYEGLFYLDNKFQPQPMLCQSWEGDGITFKFQLQQGITFWSGEELTAEDVVYTLKTAQSNETSPYFSRLADAQSIFADGQYTVGITLSSANMDFIKLLDIPIFRRGSENDSFADGTGAYRPAYEEGEWYLAPYENWHGGAVSAFSRIDLIETLRSDAIINSFETGDISLIRTERISANPVNISGSVDLHQTPTTNLHYIGFACGAGPFSLPQARQGVSAAIARANICNIAFQSFADAAVAPVNPQPDPAVGSVAADRDTALAAFAQANISDTNGDGVLEYDNFSGNRVRFAPSILVNNENAFKVSAAQQIADCLLAVGIPATVDAVPFEEYTARLLAGTFDMYYGETRMMPDFDLRSLVCTGGLLNYGRYSNFETDNQVQNARAVGTAEAKQALYTQLINETPIAPIAFIRDQVVVRSGLITEFNPSPYWLFHGVAGWRQE